MANYENQHHERNESQSDSNINTKDFLIGVLIGGFVGAATALFLAPKSGKEIRSDINTQALSLKDKTTNLRDAAVTKGTELVEVAKEKTNTLSQTVSKQSTELINKVKNLKPTGAVEEVLAEEAVEEQAELSVEEPVATAEDSVIQTKLEETKKAFDETELLLNS